MRYCERCRASFQGLRACPRDGLPTRADLGDPLLGHVLGDRYRILERIAAGGMGQVYRAAHCRIATLFAVKVMYGDIAQDSRMRSRFEREAEAMSCLASRHIVRVADFGESPEGLLYLVMEYLDGATLSSVVSRDGPFTPERAASVGRQMARGLAHAHERGVVHRDLKSANVMLVADDDEPDVVRLLDFGIARLASGAPLTEAGMVMGTPQYMAPEQFAGAEVDERADLYALGIILYEALTGSPPFDAASIPELAYKQAMTEPPPLAGRDLARPLPPALEAVVMRLLAKAPGDRFQSARAVVDALAPARLEPVRPSLPPRSSSAGPRPLVDEGVAEAIDAAIRIGAPTYNAGDHAGCFAIYRATAERILGSGLESAAAAARLEVALARAASQPSATLAAWEMRYAFDDLLHGHLPAGAAPAGSLPRELATAAALVAPRYAAGHLDLVGDYYLRFAQRLLGHLGHTGTNPTLCRYLEAAVDVATRAGGGQRALVGLGSALEGIRAGLNPTSPALPLLGGRVVGPFAAARDTWDRIVQAIGVGAPAYNTGNVAACQRIYRQTAEELVDGLANDPAAGEVRAVLERALVEAREGSVDQGAWALRHAFDSILAALPPA